MPKHQWKNNFSERTLNILVFLALVISFILSTLSWLSIPNKFMFVIILEHISMILGIYIFICIGLNEFVDCRI